MNKKKKEGIAFTFKPNLVFGFTLIAQKLSFEREICFMRSVYSSIYKVIYKVILVFFQIVADNKRRIENELLTIYCIL